MVGRSSVECVGMDEDYGGGGRRDRVKRLLRIGLMMDDPRSEPLRFDTRTECMAAAEDLAERNPSSS